MNLRIYAGTDVYHSANGRVALFQNGDRNLAVRHMGFVLYTHTFQANNFDFAWKLYETDDGIQIFNDYGGGHWIGYDAGRDVILIVPPSDPRRVTWRFSPNPPRRYLERRGKPTPRIEPSVSRYFGRCDPTRKRKGSRKFSICVFRSDVGLNRIPAINLADSGGSRLHFVGKGALKVVNLHNLGQFRRAVPNTPSENYAWAIYGRLRIRKAGSYTLCITSDDG